MMILPHLFPHDVHYLYHIVRQGERQIIFIPKPGGVKKAGAIIVDSQGSW